MLGQGESVLYRNSPAFIIALLALAGLAASSTAGAPPDEGAAKACATTFGNALKSGDATLLRPILPSRGKVQMRLVRMGPEDGDFSASQVEAVFLDFLKRGAVRTFEVVRVEHDDSGYALVRTRTSLIDRSGRADTVGVQLALQPEGDRWVLAGIRELPR